MAKSVLLHGGRIVDGSGGPSWRGDVLLHDGKILCLGEALKARLPELLSGIVDVELVNCEGLVIAPGFIDVHTHDDAIVLKDPAYLAKLSQGITTLITGNCGISLAPFKAQKAGPPLSLLGEESFVFTDFKAYADAVKAAQPALNVAALIGHTTLRYACMNDLRVPATADQALAMRNLLEESLRAGAYGLSSGLFYEEAFAAPGEEVADLAGVVARYGGVYATHLRTEMQAILEAMVEAADASKHAGVPLILSHHKCAGPSQWGRTRETLALVDELAAQQEIHLDVYPYTAGSTVLREDLIDGQIEVLVTWSKPHPECGGRSLAAIAQEWGLTQQEAARKLMPGGACYFQMREDDVERVLAHPRTMIGSDGLPHDSHPHPRLWGAFPRVLSRYWREKGLFSLEQAIHKMTGLSARNFRIPDRGVLRSGAWADIVVFDAGTVADTATYDKPISASVGIERVYVNGNLAYSAEQGLRALARSGKMLLRS